MAHQNPEDWRDTFCGRQAELQRLVAAYEAVAAGGGPRLAVVCAERGMGKTRLVQELYRHLSTAHDPDDYWPDASLFKGNNLRVAPDFSDPQTQAHFASFTTAERPMPFLWWGLRLNDPQDRNAVRSDMAAHRRTLDPHLERARFAREHAARHAAVRHSAKDTAKDAALKIGEALLDSVPGVGLGKNLVEVGLGVFKTARARREAQREQEAFARADLAGLEAHRVSDIDERTLDDLASVLETADGPADMPVVVFCDDAQFARDGGDEGALRFLDRLWRRAADGGWPLLLVATHWAVDWERDRQGEARSFAGCFDEVAADRARSTIIALPKQSDLGTMIERGLAGLPRPDAELLLHKVDGNPQVLIELIGLVQRSPAWRSRQGALTPHGRKAIEQHHCNLTKLITDRLLSDATPQDVRLAVALSSVQGMQFLGTLTEAAAQSLDLGPTDTGLCAAADPMRLVVGLEAGVASFVQRAYRDAAESVIGTLCDPDELKVAVLQAAIDFIDDDERFAALSADKQRAMLGVTASLGSDSGDAATRLRAGQSLCRLLALVTEKAQRAAHARRFEAGLGTAWPIEAFTLAQLDAVRGALGEWYGGGRTVELGDRIVARLRSSAGPNPTDDDARALEQALFAAALAHEARGAYNAAFERLHERAESMRRRLAASPTPEHADQLCRALGRLAGAAAGSTEHRAKEFDLLRECVALRRRALADCATPDAHEDLAHALTDLWVSLPSAEGIDVLREIADVRRSMAAASDDEATHVEAAQALMNLAADLDRLGRHAEATDFDELALAGLRACWQRCRSAGAGQALAFGLDEAGQRREAAGEPLARRRLLMEALDVLNQLPDAADTPDALHELHRNLARSAAATAEWDLARRHCLQAESLARQLGYSDTLADLRTELAGQVPDGVEWLDVEELSSELDATASARGLRLDEMRLQFAEASARSAALCNDLAIALQRQTDDLVQAGRWDEAEAAALECAQVEGWARAHGVHAGAYTDADCLELLAWGLRKAGRPADALKIAQRIVALRRDEAEKRADERGLAGALWEAAEVGEEAGDWTLAAQFASDWLAVERRLVERDGDVHRAGDLVDPLQRLSRYARRNGDWPLHDALQQECLTHGRLIWETDGQCDALVESACALIESAQRRGDAKSAEALAPLVAGTLREVREQQGIATGFAPLIGTLAAVALALDALSGPAVQDLRAEALRAIAAFATACGDFAKLQNAAVGLRNAGWLDAAEPLQRRAVAVAVDRHGADSTEAATGYSALGMILQTTGKKLDAKRLYRQALVIRERKFGADAEATRLVRERLSALESSPEPLNA